MLPAGLLRGRQGHETLGHGTRHLGRRGSDPGADCWRQCRRLLRRRGLPDRRPTISPRPPSASTDYCMVGYRLAEDGFAPRAGGAGLCHADADGFLTDGGRGGGHSDGRGGGNLRGGDEGGRRQRFSGDEVVSMNMWGFTPAVFGQLERPLRPVPSAIAARWPPPSSIFPRPSGARAGKCRPGEAPPTAAAEWIGATYTPDKALVVERIRTLIDAGAYPTPLWPGGSLSIAP